MSDLEATVTEEMIPEERLLLAIEDPARYWEERAAVAETEVARLRGEVQRLESSKLLAASMMAEQFCGEEVARLRG